MNVFKDATKQELEAEIARLENRRQELFKQKEPIDAELVSAYETIQKLRNKVGKIELAGLAEEGSIAYHLDMTNDSGVRHSAASKFFQDMGVMSSGYRRDTMQRAITITMTKGSEKSFEETKLVVEAIIPYLKEGEDGVKRFDILEHTCSAGGTSYDLCIHQDGTATVSSGRFDRAKPTTLDKALRYIQENVWYESVNPEDKDYDY
jgi:hypothetical protein